MEDLIFEKVNNGYEAYFEATSDFVLHIESEEDLRVVVYHTSVDGGSYDVASVICNTGKVADKPYHAMVYPKKLRLFTQNVITHCTVKKSQGSSSSTDIEALRALILEQASINASQQEQIDNNTRVNDEQEVKIVDNTNLATPESVEYLFKK